MSLHCDLSDTLPGERLYGLQAELLEAIASGRPLQAVAELVCAQAERLLPGVLCSVLAIDTHGRLRPLAAPGLPPAFCAALDGTSIAAHGSPCAAATLLGEASEVREVDSDPLWGAFRRLGLPLDLRACWSSPIKARGGRVVGKFVFYYRTRRGPNALERAIVAACVHPCAIAFDHDAAQLRMHRLTCNDPLTGLPNRSSFREQAMRQVATLPPDCVATVVSIDLDDYKSVNEALGHRGGDQLLREIAERLLACLGEHALLGRFGGDCFMALVIASVAESEVSQLVRKLLATLDLPFNFDGQKIRIGACVGLTQSASAAVPLAELSRQADMALNEAKAQGPYNWRTYAPEMSAAVRSRRSLKRDVRNAIDNGDFSLAYQPIVLMGSRQPVAAEALLRWHHPQRGQVPPAVFIPVAEEMGLIGVLGEWVLHEACRTALAWPREITLGVNLSPLQFRKSNFVDDIVNALESSGLPARRLDLEITESTLLAQDLPTRTALYALHDLGVRLSLDDFGTGFSSLLSLRTFPFDRLKIDMSFVRGIGIDADSTAIIRAVIGLAHDLGIRTVAEGVETEEQYEWLSKNACSEGQGHLFGKPMSAVALQHLLTQPPGRAGDRPASAAGALRSAP